MTEQERVEQWRNDGRTWGEIAGKLGMSYSGVFRKYGFGQSEKHRKQNNSWYRREGKAQAKAKRAEMRLVRADQKQQQATAVPTLKALGYAWNGSEWAK